MIPDNQSIHANRISKKTIPWIFAYHRGNGFKNKKGNECQDKWIFE